MAPFINKSNLPREREASDAGLIEEAPRPIREFNCRDLGINPVTEPEAEQQSKLSRIISGIDQKDTTDRYEVEAEDNKISIPNSAASSVTPAEKKIIHWEDGDPDNPYNWSSVRKVSSQRGPENLLTFRTETKGRNRFDWNARGGQ